MELLPEHFKRTKHNSLPYPSHRVKVKVEIMQRVKGRGGHLVGQKKVPKIRPREAPARVALALRIWRPRILREARVLDDDASLAREQLAIASVARRQHAVEEVYRRARRPRPDRRACRFPSDTAGDPRGAAAPYATTMSYIVSTGSPTLSPPMVYASNPTSSVRCTLSARRSGSMPPCTIPNCA